MAELNDVLASHPLVNHAFDAATAAGDFLLNGRPDQLRVDAKSSPTDAVTQMDREAERMLTDLLLADRPNDGLIGEEGAERRGSSGVTWIVDPLDGTVNYLYRLPMWGVSIAAEIDGIPSIGVVVTPAFDEAFIGVRGSGSWHIEGMHATPIHRKTDPELGHALVATGFAYTADRRAEQAALVQQLLPRVRDIRRMGACVVDLCWLALGRLDAYYEIGLHPWDYLAATVIARESGQRVTGFTTEDPSPQSLIAGPPRLHAELRTFLRGAVDAAE